MFLYGEKDYHNQRTQFCGDDCPPDAVQTKELRQQQDENSLKDQCAQRWQNTRDQPVIQCGKERGSKHVEADKQERQRKNLQTVLTKWNQFRLGAQIASGKDSGAGIAQKSK